MNKKASISLTFLSLCNILYSTPLLAFSPAPEHDDAYAPAIWQSSASATNDANDAIRHDDFRLLGFAGRGGNIPGINNAQLQTYKERCGVRFFKEFGDVIRERKQLDQMKKAKRYAADYNRIILTSCLQNMQK